MLADPAAIVAYDYPGWYVEANTDSGASGAYSGKKMPWVKISTRTNFAICGTNQYPSAADVGSGRGVFHLGWANVLPGSLGSGVNGWTMYGDGSTTDTLKKIKWAVPDGRRRGASAPMGTLYIDVGATLPANVAWDNNHLVIDYPQDYTKIIITGTWGGSRTKRVILTPPAADIYEDCFQVLVDNATDEVITLAGFPSTGATCSLEGYGTAGCRDYIDVFEGGCQFARA